MTTRRLFATLALAAGVLAAVAGERSQVTALELAQWIHDRKPHLRVVDLRSDAEFASFHLPRSERVPADSISKIAADPQTTVVMISDGPQAAVTLQTLGHRNVFFLRGGVKEWADEILQPEKPSDLTRYFGGMPRVDGEAPASIRTIRRRGC